MGGFFNIDGPFYKFGEALFDLFMLNLLWILLSLPIVTIGASTTALFYVTGKKARKQDGYLFKDFFKSFKENFKQSTIIWIILLAGFLILRTNMQNIHLLGKAATWFFVFYMVMLIELIIISIYIFHILSRFHMTIKGCFTTAFLMAHKHLPTTFLCGVVFVGVFAIMYYWSFFMLFFVSTYAFGSSYMIQRVFKKYIPENE
jgi:uncharacterized membrane protein YesL